ncbi:MAG: hypothetical protein Q8M11_03625 [Sulfuritalea sp.]|nr:hypothetical protein [Sulfuritalea sp.]MDP1982017.1 hypothetical protein [Sulfuritalea sp.]
MKYKLSFVLSLASTLVFAQSGGIGAIKLDPNPVRAGQDEKQTASTKGGRLNTGGDGWT